MNRRGVLASAFAMGLLAAASQAGAQLPAFEAGVEHLRQSRWLEAIVAFTPIVAENPYDGLAQFFLGAAHSRANQCDRAEPALEAGIRLGVSGATSVMRQARFFLASCRAARGDGNGALAQLDTAWRWHGLRDFASVTAGPRFASIINTEPYRALAGIPPTPITDRAERWLFDLRYLDRLIRETHPNAFHTVSEREWANGVAALAQRIPSLNDGEVVLALMQLVARVRDGHTALYPPIEGDLAWRLLPIRPVRLADGWYVGAAAPEHRSLVGGRILSAGRVSIDALDSLVQSALASDNEWTARWLAEVPLQFAESYQAAGAAHADGSVTLRVARADDRVDSATVRPAPLDRDPTARWAPASWPTMAGRNAPRWLRYADAPVAVEWLSRERVLYIAINAVADADAFSFAALGTALRDSIVQRRPTGIILDLRMNNGGNGHLIPAFLRPLLAVDLLQEPGALQVLTGPRTYSASMFLLNELARFTRAERVGWPTGGRPVLYASETPFTLPLSALRGSISARLEMAGFDATDRRPFLAPHRLVWPTGANLARGADPVFDAAIDRIRLRSTR